MSSSSNQLLSAGIPPEHAVTREDFELLQRFLRVARLLKGNDIDGLCNQHEDSTSTQYEDEYDDDDYDDDEEGDEVEQDGTDATMFSQSVGRGNRNPPLSQHNHSNNQQNNTRAADQRQLQRRRQRRSQPQQQHQHQKQQQHRPHAAVEKRYRSDMNRKIQELNALIPASNTFSPIHSNAPPDNNQEAGGATLTTTATTTTTTTATQETPTKSVVLDRAIHYLHHLVSTYEQYQKERNELRRGLQLWLDDGNVVGGGEDIGDHRSS